MKKIVRDDGRSLVIEISSPWPVFSGILALIFTCLPLLHTALHEPMSRDRIIGCIGAASTALLIYLFAYEKNRFDFDGTKRMLTWVRRRSLSKREGTVPFDRLKRVDIQTCMGGNAYYPRQRVVMATADGELPVTVAYEHDPMNAVIAERIRRFLGPAEGNPLQERVEELAANGRTIDAVRLLREQQGLSLMEAKKSVEEIRARNGRT